MYASSDHYYPTHFYQNNFANNIQIYNYPQQISYISNQNYQQRSSLQKSPQSMIIIQKPINEEEIKQQQKHTHIQEKIINISQIFQISSEEVQTLLSENICLCCMKKFFQNKQNNKTTQLDHYKEYNSKFSGHKPQFQTLNKILESKSSQDDNIENSYICNNISNLFNQHLKHEEDKMAYNIERNTLFLPTNNKKQYNIKIEGNEKFMNKYLDLQNEMIQSESYQQSKSLEIIYDRQKIESQQEILEDNSEYKIKEKLLETNLIENVNNSIEQSLQQDQSILNKENKKKFVSFSIIKKPIFKKESEFIKLKRNKIPIKNNQQICPTNDIQEYIAYQDDSDRSQMKSQINKQSFNLPIQSASSCSNKVKCTEISYDKLNDSNLDEQTIESNKQFQSDSNYTKNLLKGFRRVVIKKHGNNIEFIDRFKKYFDSFSLNNEFIMKLFSDSPYTVYFGEFLSTDPSWWLKEARIKDTENHKEFFEICRQRKFSQIRTKRKKFTRPKL